MKKRKATKKRPTKETDILVKLDVDGNGKAKIDTGIGFLDHMFELFAFWGLFDLEIKAKGDLKVDIHHTNEDIGIVIGDAFREALGDMKGIRRIGSSSVPMEKMLARVSLDISGRGFFEGIKYEGVTQIVDDNRGYSLMHANHLLEAFANKLGMNLSVEVSGVNLDLHANLEPVFKALGIALDQATQIDPRRKGVPSTKGVID